jgi:hypothetical protein
MLASEHSPSRKKILDRTAAPSYQNYRAGPYKARLPASRIGLKSGAASAIVPPMSQYDAYLRIKDANRRSFEQNYGADLQSFETLSATLNCTWERLGTTRDAAGHSHVGLLHFANLLRRHSILAFESIASYQSYLMWSNFRAGLEALLILAKLVDDPANAAIWLNRGSSDPRTGKPILRRLADKVSRQSHSPTVGNSERCSLASMTTTCTQIPILPTAIPHE